MRSTLDFTRRRLRHRALRASRLPLLFLLLLLLLALLASACGAEPAPRPEAPSVEDAAAEDAAAEDAPVETVVVEETAAEEEVEQGVEQEIDETPHETHAAEAEAIRRLLDLEAGDVVADVGAGDGNWAERLAAFVGPTGTVWATEVDEDLVAELEARAEDLPQIRPVLGDQDSTGLEANCCDAILLRLVYHHFTDPAVMRADLRRALRPGGRLLVIDITPQEDWRRLPGVPEREGRSEGHGLTLERLVAEMEQDGFRAVELRPGWGDEEDRYAVLFVERAADYS